MIKVAAHERAVPANALPESSAGTFSSLRSREFRIFVTGQAFSYTGNWVQRVAQDWLVLTLSGSATDVGVATALQFLPTMMLSFTAGRLADRYSKRTLLVTTCIGMSTTALILAVLCLTHAVQTWHVFVLAFVLGLGSAVDQPTRATMVTSFVESADVRNAISLNSLVFQFGGIVGPALAGIVIGALGPGWAFAINAASFVPPIVALMLLRDHGTAGPARPDCGRPDRGSTTFRGLLQLPHLRYAAIFGCVFGIFTSNLQVTLSAFAKNVFHSGAGGYGTITAIYAVGASLAGLLSARRPSVRLRTLFGLGTATVAAYAVASAMPDQASFCVAIVAIGICSLSLLIATTAMVQVAVPESQRGRAVGIYLFFNLGGAALGGTLVGSVDQHFGARAGLVFGAVLPGAVLVCCAARLVLAQERPTTGGTGRSSTALRGRRKSRSHPSGAWSTVR